MAKSRQPKRRVLSVRLPEEVIERLKSLVRDGAGKPLYLTLAGTVENALTKELDRIEGILDASIVDLNKAGGSSGNPLVGAIRSSRRKITESCDNQI